MDAFVFSIANFAVLFWPIKLVLFQGYLDSNPFVSWLILIGCFFVVPIIWPNLIVKLLKLLAKKGKILVRSPTAWDEVFSNLSDGAWVIVEFNDGSRLGGKFGEQSYASSYPDFGHIYIQEVWNVDNNGNTTSPLPGKPGMILKPNDYHYIKVLRG